jgi:integrase
MRTKVPGYRRHHKGYGFVTLDGKNIYFGKYEDPQSKIDYDRTIQEWLSNGRSLVKPESGESSDITVARLLELFWIHAQKTYTKNGKPTSQLTNIRLAIRVAREAYGESLARDFSAVRLRRIREAIIDEGKLCRSEVNRRCKIIGQIFRWAVGEGLVPPAVAQSIREFAGLRKGRSDVPDHPKVKPVPRDAVDAVLGFLSPQCAAMVELQWCTGMRPGEVCIMRACDIDENHDYRPHSHKREHHDLERVVYLPPQARAILEPWLKSRAPTDYLFSAREAMDAARPPSTIRRRTKRNPKRQPGSHFTPVSYYHAVETACRKAGIERWHPHQLRHSFLTRCEEQCGAETARVQAGHTKASMTERYISRDRDIARKALDQMT